MAFVTKIVGLAATAFMVATLFGGSDAAFIVSGNIVESCAVTGANLTAYPRANVTLTEGTPANLTANVTANLLGAYCRNADSPEKFTYSYSWLNLDYCFANNVGALMTSPNGNYSNSCSGCRLETANETIALFCTCTNMDHVLAAESSVDLKPVVLTTNGTLHCLDHVGVRVDNDTLPIQPNWG